VLVLAQEPVLALEEALAQVLAQASEYL